MPNSFAYLMLFAWPFVVFFLFRRLSLPKALIWSILGGFLILPVKTEVDFPVVPALDKTLIPSLAAFMMCLFARPPKRVPGMAGPAWRPGWLPENRLALTLVLIYLLSPFLTGLLNSAPVYSGGMLLPGITLYDAASQASSHAVLLLPFLFGRRYLSDPGSHRLLLTCFVVGGLAYSIPILFEVRISPQLHTWIYGFFPHSFLQQMRFGGFRAVVFLGHGLWVAMFIALTLLAAVAMWRASEGALRRQAGLAVVWLGLILVLSKSVGALLLAIVFAPLMAFAGQRLLRISVMAFALVVLVYPMLRGVDVVPTETLLSVAQSIDEDRAGSLQFRFDNEDILLERANLQPVFGWGSWGRNRVFNEAGRDISVTDGTWIITMGVYGWVGYLAEFGLLTIGIVLLLLSKSNVSMPFASAAVAIVLVVNLVNLLPNSTLTPMTWLMAGSLVGYVENAKRSRKTPIRLRSDFVKQN